MMTSPSKTVAPVLILDEALADFIISQVRRAFAEMFLTEVRSQKHYFDRDTSLQGDISGTVGLIQEQYEGTLSVSFEKRAIFSILSKVYGAPITEVAKPVRDGAGEITNILYCMFKKRLNESGHCLKMAIPSVVVGPGHQLYEHHERGRSLTIEFEIPEGRFFVRILLQRS